MGLRNRGKDSNDDKLFGTIKVQHNIQLAVRDLSYLLTHNYLEKSSIQLVGNRYKLNLRQQKAVMGMSCGEQYKSLRKQSQTSLNNISNKNIVIDGFNLLITLESALSGAYVFKGIDGNYRDVSSVHGTYKRVNQTQEVLKLVGDELKLANVSHVEWIFDKPVSKVENLK